MFEIQSAAYVRGFKVSRHPSGAFILTPPANVNPAGFAENLRHNGYRVQQRDNAIIAFN